MDSPRPPAETDPTAQVMEALHQVVDPEIGIDVVDLGLIYAVRVDADDVAWIDMTLTSAACPLTDVIEAQTYDALSGVVADFHIEWVWMPPWSPDRISDEGKEQMRALGMSV